MRQRAGKTLREVTLAKLPSPHHAVKRRPRGAGEPGGQVGRPAAPGYHSPPEPSLRVRRRGPSGLLRSARLRRVETGDSPNQIANGRPKSEERQHRPPTAPIRTRAPCRTE